jgi:hypothetical protein
MVPYDHRYLMTRLSLQVVYLWRHVSSTAPPFILWWSNWEILFGPLHRSSPFIGELRCQGIQMEHGPFIAERTQNAVYIVRCLCLRHTCYTISWYIQGTLNLASLIFFLQGFHHHDSWCQTLCTNSTEIILKVFFSIPLSTKFRK